MVRPAGEPAESLELNDDTCRDFRAVLTGAEVPRADQVSREAQSPALMAEVEIHAGAGFEGERRVSTQRGLRKKIQISHEAVPPNLDAARSKPPNSGPASRH